MIVDIFSSFDPYINYGFQASPVLFWLFIIISLFMVRASYWVIGGRLMWVVSYPLDIINIQSIRTFSLHIKGFTTLVVSLFVILIVVNFLGLLPYRFRYSRHMVFRLMFGLPLWFFLIISRFANSPFTFIAGLLPGGAPD